MKSLILSLVILVLSLPAWAQQPPPGRRPRIPLRPLSNDDATPPSVPQCPPRTGRWEDTAPDVLIPCRPPAPPGSLPELPRRSDVAAAMRALGRAVRACGGRTPNAPRVAVVTFSFDPFGVVSGLVVRAPVGGTVVGSCVARAVRPVHVPPFRRATFTVTYPFSLR